MQLYNPRSARVKKSPLLLTALLVALMVMAGCTLKLGSKTIKLSLDNTMQSYDQTFDKATVWDVQGMATDAKGIKYYIYTNGEYVIYIHPYKKVVYARSGDVIGFVDTDKVIRLHDPADGWGTLDISGVGEIKNPYEGQHLPDFSIYKTPKSKVKK
jgi:hypothetical protein